MPKDKTPKRRRALRATDRAQRLARMRGATMTLEEAYLLKCAAWDGPEPDDIEQGTLNRIEAEAERLHDGGPS